MLKGQVRCGKIPDRFGQGQLQPDGTTSKVHPNIPGFANINVSSGGGQYKVLSPMKLGPLAVYEKKIPLPGYPDGVHPGFESYDEDTQVAVAQIFENWWQGSKVYNVDVQNGEIQMSFFQRRAEMFADPKPHRRSLPKAKGYPVAGYFDGEILGYVVSRFFYIQTYENLIREKPEYQQLVQRVNRGENLQFIGYDGRDPASGLPYGANPITYEILEREMYNPARPFGHELVLCGMLLGLRPWDNFDVDRAWAADNPDSG
jgi:hypothetical protein